MAETTDDVRRDIERTRERMSSTIAQLEQRLNVVQVVREHPWPALALAFGAGLALSASSSGENAAAATLAAASSSRNRLGAALDDVVATLVGTVNGAIESRVANWVDELKTALGGPAAARRPSGGYGTGPLHDVPGVRPGHLQRAD